MRREIVCLLCAEVLLRRVMETAYIGDNIKFVNGKSKRNSGCDRCSNFVLYGKRCTAVSMWSDTVGIPYGPWEEEYLFVIEEEVEELGEA